MQSCQYLGIKDRFVTAFVEAGCSPWAFDKAGCAPWAGIPGPLGAVTQGSAKRGRRPAIRSAG